MPDHAVVRDKHGGFIHISEMKEQLLGETAKLDLPQFPLDELIENLGGPQKVRGCGR